MSVFVWAISQRNVVIGNTYLLVTISLIAFEAFPATPSFTSLELFPLVSLALTSVTWKPSCRAMIFAALVFPIPGGPEIKTA
jgi:hypothetical protein